MGCEFTSCRIEVRDSLCDELRAKLIVGLLDEATHKLTNIIEPGQDYRLRVCVALGSQIKKLLCGEWCISVTLEGISLTREFRRSKVIPMRNTHEKPDYCDFKIQYNDFERLSSHYGGDLFNLVVVVVARDSIGHAPIDIAGFCKVGPIIVY